MYPTLLVFHSVFRWLVLTSLLYAIFRAYRGVTTRGLFTKTDNSVRHWTATIAHLQLIIGFTLYLTSPLIKTFLTQIRQASGQLLFFGVARIGIMLISIVLITIGSALAKRRPTDREKFSTMLVWFSISLALIFLAIPWPFSPFANRPYLRLY